MRYLLRLLCWKIAELALRILILAVLVAPAALDLAIALIPGLILQALGVDILIGLFVVFVALPAVHVWVAAPYIWPAADSASKQIGRYILDMNHQFWRERNARHMHDGDT